VGEARLTFLATLRAGLRGAPPEAIDDIVADYASHFDVGANKGRSEEQIAAALGDPLILADELRIEMQIERWRKKRSPVAAARLVAGIVSLGVLNVALAFIALPLACLLVFVVIAWIIMLLVGGVWFAFAGGALGLNPAMSMLAGAGLVFAGVALGALLALLLLALVNVLARYARLHYRLLPHPGQTRKGAP
jgi:uncharacterized membrane protein